MQSKTLDAKVRVEIWKKLNQIDNVPTLPTIFFKLQNLLSRPDASIQDVRKIIEEDPPTVAKILQRVNSGYYNTVSSIRNIQQAIVMLGMTELYNIVVELSVLSMFREIKESEYFSFEKFLRHSSATARTAGAIRKHLGLNFDNAELTCGLLHDFGRLILCLHFEDLYREVFEHSIQHGISLYEAESECLDFTHAEAGFWLAKRWQLPREIADVMLHHHAVVPEDVRAHPLRAITYIANLITNTWGVSLEPLPTFHDIEKDPIWQEMAGVYLKLASFPLDDMINILKLPPEDDGLSFDANDLLKSIEPVKTTSLQETTENLVNSIKELHECLQEQQISQQAAFSQLTDMLQTFMKFDLLSIYRYDTESGKMSLIFGFGEPASALDVINFRRGKGAVSWVFQHRQSTCISNAKRSNSAGDRLVNTFLGAPILLSDKVTGVLAVGSYQQDHFDERDQYLLEIAGEYLDGLLL